ncbi:AIR synthase family protein [Halobacteriaceae archaeon GCM10025711]
MGKVDPETLADLVFARTGAPDDDDVVMGPTYGEDTAAVRVGDQTLVVNSDPISLAAERIGTLGVHVACNDVAASGADPRWLNNVIFLPDDRPDLLDTITADIHTEATDLGVAVIGGHSEYAAELSRPLVSMTCMGVTDRYVATGGASPGDVVILTKGAGVEGTAILATDFREELLGTVPASVLDAAAGFFEDISVVPDAAAVRAFATSMHDPTEGGLVDGLLEVASASDVAVQVDRDAIPVREETRQVCAAMDVDPLRILGSGALVVAVPADDADSALDALSDAGVEASVIGDVVESDTPELRLGDDVVREPVRDDIYRLWEE